MPKSVFRLKLSYEHPANDRGGFQLGKDLRPSGERFFLQGHEGPDPAEDPGKVSDQYAGKRNRQCGTGTADE